MKVLCHINEFSWLNVSNIQKKKIFWLRGVSQCPGFDRSCAGGGNEQAGRTIRRCNRCMTAFVSLHFDSLGEFSPFVLVSGNDTVVQRARNLDFFLFLP